MVSALAPSFMLGASCVYGALPLRYSVRYVFRAILGTAGLLTQPAGLTGGVPAFPALSLAPSPFIVWCPGWGLFYAVTLGLRASCRSASSAERRIALRAMFRHWSEQYRLRPLPASPRTCVPHSGHSRLGTTET